MHRWMCFSHLQNFSASESDAGHKIGYDLRNDFITLEKRSGHYVLDTIAIFPFKMNESRLDYSSVEIMFFDKTNLEKREPSISRAKYAATHFLHYFENAELKIDDLDHKSVIIPPKDRPLLRLRMFHNSWKCNIRFNCSFKHHITNKNHIDSNKEISSSFQFFTNIFVFWSDNFCAFLYICVDFLDHLNYRNFH